MTSPTLTPELIEIFADVMDVPAEGLSASTTAEDVPEWDSLSNVRLIMSLERAFKIQFANDEIASWTCLGDIEKALAR